MFGPWKNAKKDWLSEHLDGKTTAVVIGSVLLMFYANYLDGQQRRLPPSKRNKRPLLFLLLGLGGLAGSFGIAYLRYRRARAEAEPDAPGGGAASQQPARAQQRTADQQEAESPTRAAQPRAQDPQAGRRDSDRPRAGRPRPGAAHATVNRSATGHGAGTVGARPLHDLLRAMSPMMPSAAPPAQASELRQSPHADPEPATDDAEPGVSPGPVSADQGAGIAEAAGPDKARPDGEPAVTDPADTEPAGEPAASGVDTILARLTPEERDQVEQIRRMLAPESAAAIQARLAALPVDVAVAYLRDVLQRHTRPALAEAA